MQSFGRAPAVRLNNGIVMPQVGFGVYQIPNGEDVEAAVSRAFDAGYRAIDTAAVYGNEEGVGRAIALSGIPREELFITSKLWNDDHGFESAKQAFEASLERLNLEYLDLYLIHWPQPKKGKFVETWQAFEEMYEDGKMRAIGVSNFKPKHLDLLLEKATIVPAVNQIELHPMMTQLETREYCKQRNIAIESWSPLMQGKGLLQNKTIAGIANAHGKEPAQVVLRWHLQSGLIAIPKSATPERIESNYNIFNFELSQDEMARIDGLNQDRRIGPDPDNL